MKALCRTLALVLFLSLCVLLFPLPAAALPRPEITAKQALCINLETGKVLYEKNASTPIAPASFAKIMTAVLALEYRDENHPETVEVTKRALASVSGSKLGFREGEIIAYDDLLAALIIANANDAAYLLADTVAGSTAAFVLEMNQKAILLGMKNTHFTNPAGTDEAGMTTTLSDMAILAEYAYNIPDYQTFSSAETYTIPPTAFKKKGYSFSNNNKLMIDDPRIGYFVSGAVGLNAGGTDRAGYCCVSILPFNGLTTLAIVSGSTYVAPTYMHFKDVSALLNYAKKGYVEMTVVKQGEIIYELPVEQGKEVDHVIAITDRNISGLLPADLDPEKDLVFQMELTEKTLTAPVKQGAVLGHYTILYQGEVLGSAQLVAQSPVNRNFWLYLLSVLESVVKNPWVSALLLILLIVTVGALILLILYWLFGEKMTAYRKKLFKKSPPPPPADEDSDDKKKASEQDKTKQNAPASTDDKTVTQKPVKATPVKKKAPVKMPKKVPNKKPSKPVSDLLGDKRNFK